MPREEAKQNKTNMTKQNTFFDMINSDLKENILQSSQRNLVRLPGKVMIII